MCQSCAFFFFLGHFISCPQETTLTGNNPFSLSWMRSQLEDGVSWTADSSATTLNQEVPVNSQSHACAQRGGSAPFPSALTFINLICAAGVSVTALNVVISTKQTNVTGMFQGSECGVTSAETQQRLLFFPASRRLCDIEPSRHGNQPPVCLSTADNLRMPQLHRCTQSATPGHN